MERENDCHKGDFGHVLVAGGDYGMGGAVLMAAKAASRVGAGKVTVFTRPEHALALLNYAPNVMSAADFEEALAGKNVIAIGCGLGVEKWGEELFLKALASDLVKIIDADGLNLVARMEKVLDLKNCVITPHVGEAARLLGCETAQINADREGAVRDLWAKYGAVVVLKGCGSLVFDGLEVKKCDFGNSGMATAGMGDVLTGVIAGLVAQKVDLARAAYLGVCKHGQAGDLMAREYGKVGMVPDDVIERLPRVLGVE